MIDIADQYRIIATGAGWVDRTIGPTARGRLRFDGADRASFLQALLSNEVAALAAGAGTYALYLTPQGRLIADLHVFVRPDGLVVDVPAQKAAALAAMFELPADIAPVPVEINQLDNQALVRYYEKEWRRWE